MNRRTDEQMNKEQMNGGIGGDEYRMSNTERRNKVVVNKKIPLHRAGFFY